METLVALTTLITAIDYSIVRCLTLSMNTRETQNIIQNLISAQGEYCDPNRVVVIDGRNTATIYVRFYSAHKTSSRSE